MGQLNPFRRFLLALLSMIALGTVASVSIGNAADNRGDDAGQDSHPVSSRQGK
ncbi:MAG: hypothetical protein IT427_15585 [Pirellulales bacterium]|jgi:hypothetical protein|nr:hypothetical protein [Pirellulales bacterium]